jgi:hypothetical protein
MTTAVTTPKLELKSILRRTDRKLAALAIFNLLIIELIATGAMDAEEATRTFYNADNCGFVRRLKNSAADELMSRGVQLADLFDVLPASQAKLELAKELRAMRRLCKRLQAADKNR